MNANSDHISSMDICHMANVQDKDIHVASLGCSWAHNAGQDASDIMLLN